MSTIAIVFQYLILSIFISIVSFKQPSKPEVISPSQGPPIKQSSVLFENEKQPLQQPEQRHQSHSQSQNIQDLDSIDPALLEALAQSGQRMNVLKFEDRLLRFVMSR